MENSMMPNVCAHRQGLAAPNVTAVRGAAAALHHRLVTPVRKKKKKKSKRLKKKRDTTCERKEKGTECVIKETKKTRNKENDKRTKKQF